MQITTFLLGSFMLVTILFYNVFELSCLIYFTSNKKQPGLKETDCRSQGLRMNPVHFYSSCNVLEPHPEALSTC